MDSNRICHFRGIIIQDLDGTKIWNWERICFPISKIKLKLFVHNVFTAERWVDVLVSFKYVLPV